MRAIGLFPGQGSQSVGMGKELLSSDIAKELFNIADKTLGFSLSEICFNGPESELMSTAITQPAILTVSSICYSIYRNAGKDNLLAAAGHSLGEYSALVAAEAIDFSAAVALVHKRGRYMQEAVPKGTGKMVAVLGKELSEVESAINQVDSGVAEIANINSPGQIVVAGDVAGVDRFVAILASSKVKELPVSAPFHCSLMKSAQENLKRDLAALTIKTPKFPIYQNFTASPVTDPETIRMNLELQVSGRVRWVECMQNCIAKETPEVAIEFGAGNTLTGLLKRINGDLKRKNISSIESLAQD